VSQDYVQALAWLHLAIAGFAESETESRNVAIRNRDIVAAEMTPSQRAEAQKRVAEWRSRMANVSPERFNRTSTAPKKLESVGRFGTGFLVSKEGKALTNAHVVRGCREISVSKDGQRYAAKVLARDERNDLALLATDLRTAQAVNWRLGVRQGEEIAVYGFPLTGALASSGNVTTGIVSALAGFADDSRFLQISAPVQPGNSGGPLLDRNGTVVGIIVSKLTALRVASVTGDIPQNVNFAIKASVAAAFLDAQRVVHVEIRRDGSLSTPDIADRARSFTVKVLCR
jgi:serine protease Do